MESALSFDKEHYAIKHTVDRVNEVKFNIEHCRTSTIETPKVINKDSAQNVEYLSKDTAFLSLIKLLRKQR